MPRIHRITHDNELVKRKVNFFADYFCFAAETIGTNDSIEIENPISSVDKIVFQIIKNPNRCAVYIDSYLTHVSFSDYEHFKEFKSYKKLQSLIGTYWQYLETIIPAKQNDSKQVVDIVSNLLLLNAESHHKNRLKNYIIDAISPFNASADYLGISVERQLEVLNKPETIDWDSLRTEINHPFINHLLTEFLTKFNRNDLSKRKATYERVL